MAKIVQVEVKTVYGREMIYPVNGTAKLFALLTQTKTFSKSDLSTTNALGFTVEQVFSKSL